MVNPLVIGFPVKTVEFSITRQRYFSTIFANVFFFYFGDLFVRFRLTAGRQDLNRSQCLPG